MSEDMKPRKWVLVFDHDEEIGYIRTFAKYDKKNRHDEHVDVIEIEPTIQLMKEMGEILKKSELILSYQNLTTLPIHVREPDGSISMQRPKSQIGLLYDETKEVLEKYRKFLEGIEK